jgi:hypothetical protein
MLIFFKKREETKKGRRTGGDSNLEAPLPLPIPAIMLPPTSKMPVVQHNGCTDDNILLAGPFTIYSGSYALCKLLLS